MLIDHLRSNVVGYLAGPTVSAERAVATGP